MISNQNYNSKNDFKSWFQIIWSQILPNTADLNKIRRGNTYGEGRVFSESAMPPSKEDHILIKIYVSLKG